MFWTAFIWGLGVSLGASVGLLAFIVAYHLLDKVLSSKTMKAAEAHGEIVIDLMRGRNEISSETAAYVAAIVDELGAMNRPSN